MSKFDKKATCMVVYNKYPADTRVRRSVEALGKAGYKVHVICSAEQGRPSRETINNVYVHRTRVVKDSGAKWSNALAMSLFIFQAVLAVIAIDRQYRPYYYHVNSLPDFLIVVALWPKMRGARIVLDLHESFPEIVLARFKTGAIWLSVVAGWLERASCFLADHVIVVNETIRNLVIGRGERSEKITVIMNSPMVFVNGSAGLLHPKVVAAKQSDDPLFVYAGGINEERDLITLVDAAALLLDRGKRLRVLLFTHTETTFLKSLLEYIKEKGMGGQISYLGGLDAENVLDNVRVSDVGVVGYVKSPLTEVALPNKVFEYLEIGCPLVVADLQTLHALLGENVTYYIPGNAESLADGIEKVLNGKNNQYTVNELQRIYSECSWPVMEKRLLEIYGRLKNEK